MSTVLSILVNYQGLVAKTKKTQLQAEIYFSEIEYVVLTALNINLNGQETRMSKKHSLSQV